MLCIGRKDYDRALDLLLYAITAPATVVSAIAVAAYQKYVLVQLIHNGHSPPLPKYTSTIIHRYLKSECVIYAVSPSTHTSRMHHRCIELAITDYVSITFE
jgi:COP9 signalosome complex subunit 3